MVAGKLLTDFIFGPGQKWTWDTKYTWIKKHRRLILPPALFALILFIQMKIALNASN